MSQYRNPNTRSGARARRFRRTVPDSVALRSDPWEIGLAAVVSTLHNMGITHIQVTWWHPIHGKGELPPAHEVMWVMKAFGADGYEATAGHSSTFGPDHGVGIVEAGADLIRNIMELQATR